MLPSLVSATGTTHEYRGIRVTIPDNSLHPMSILTAQIGSTINNLRRNRVTTSEGNAGEAPAILGMLLVFGVK